MDTLREHDYTLVVDDVTIRLAKEFGFCYGVERAVEYAYQTRRKFPDRRLVLVGEIIHNPHVNAKLRGMGIEILEPGEDGMLDFGVIKPDDVVILPAFGVTIEAFEALRAIGCVLVDTTCGSVLNVWKRVEAYARDGFTALIHGKHYHEETRATASQVMKYPGGHYLVVRHMDGGAARLRLHRRVAGRARTSSRSSRMPRRRASIPTCISQRIGVANQTTMLAKESLAIGEEVGQAMARARGARRAPRTSAPSTRSAARRRSGRTR